MPMKSKLFTKWILLITSTLTIMSSASIAPVLPRIAEFYQNYPDAELLSRLILTIPSFFIALTAPLCGIIIDLAGRKKLLLAALLLYGISGSSGFILNSLISILVSRAFLGISIAAVMTTVTTLAADYYKGDQRRKFIGLQAGFMALGGVLFVGAGGIIADLNWRLPFLVHILALLILPLVSIAIDEPDIKKSESAGKTRAEKIPVLQVIFIICFAFFSMVFFYMMPVQVPFLLQNIGINKSSAAGLAIIAFSVTGTAVSFIYPKIKQTCGFLMIYMFTFTFMSAGYLIIGTSSVFFQVAAGMLVSGMGSGMIIPNQNLWIITITPDYLRGRIIGIVSSSFFLGQFFSPVMIQPLIQSGSIHNSFRTASGLMAVSVILMIILHIFTGRRKDEHSKISI